MTIFQRRSPINPIYVLVCLIALTGNSPQASERASSANLSVGNLEPLGPTSILSEKCQRAVNPKEDKPFAIIEAVEDKFGFIKSVHKFWPTGSAFPNYQMEKATIRPVLQEGSIEIVRRTQSRLRSVSTSIPPKYLNSVQVLERHIDAIHGFASGATVARNPEARMRLVVGGNYYRDWERQVDKFALEVCGFLSFVGLERGELPAGVTLVTAGPNAGLLQAPDRRLFIPGLDFF